MPFNSNEFFQTITSFILWYSCNALIKIVSYYQMAISLFLLNIHYLCF